MATKRRDPEDDVSDPDDDVLVGFEDEAPLEAEGPHDEHTQGELSDILIASFDAIVPAPVRRALATGLGAALLTEESVRQAVERLRADPADGPREPAKRKAKERPGRSLIQNHEVLGMLKRAESARDLRKLLDGVTLELTMQVRLAADEDDADRSRSRLRARIRRKPRE